MVLFGIDIVRDHVDGIGVAESLAELFDQRGLVRDPERERALIEAALAESGGKIAGAAGAARKLGIPRQTLDSKIRSLGIDKLRFRRN